MLFFLKHRWTWILITLCCISIEPHTYAVPTSYSLFQCYQEAEQKNETLALETESISQAREHLQQAKAGFWPTLSLSASTLKQQPIDSPLGSDISPSTQTTLKGTLTQNLFRGMQDLANLRSQKSNLASIKWARESAKLQLYQDVTQAFYAVLINETDIEIYHQEHKAELARKQEILRLKKAALARESDLVTMESSIATLEALEASTQVLLQTARENLRFLLDAPTSYTLVDTDLSPTPLPPLATWLHQLHMRPEIQQAKEEIKAAQASLSAAKANHYPSLDLSTNYYMKRPGLTQDIHWDALLSLTLPLFQGGMVESRVREAAMQQSSKEIQLVQITRRLDSTLRALYASLQEEHIQAEKLQQAVVLAEKSYTLLAKDNRQGLATHMEVLTAMNRAYETQRTYNRLRLSMKSDRKKLELLAFQIPR